ncbi:MAG: AAA family ATPase [Campylobacterales bacterium]
MKKIVRFFNKNSVVAFLAGSLILSLLILAYLRESRETIDTLFYETLLQNNLIKDATLKDEYLYINSDDRAYKIAKDVIDLKKLAQNTPIDISSGLDMNRYIIYGFFIFILLLFIVALTKNYRTRIQEQTKKEPPTPKKPPVPEGLEEISLKITPSFTNTTFKDVAGIKDVKEELEEIIDFLKESNKYKDYGIRLPKGVLLIGPPGVGKTLVARAVAGEAGVPFFYQSGSTFVHLYVGVGPKRVKDLFARAKAFAPSIVFIDEIDAVGKARGGFRNDERESTLNQLLTEMDGFEDSSGVIVIGATNKIDMLDEALLRSGRFDRRVFIGLPTLEDRIEIFKTHLANKPHQVDFKELGRLSVGFSAAGIASLSNEAAIHALKRESKFVELEDFKAVKDKVLLGKHKKMSLRDDEKDILATYQAAKAIAAYWFEVDFEKVSLVSDSFKEIDKEIISKTEMISKIKVYLAGSVGVEMIHGDSFSNASEDISKARLIASEMVEKFGMGSFVIGRGEDVTEIVKVAKDEIKDMLNNLTTPLKNVKTKLLEDEFISKDEIKKCLNEVL